MNELILRYHAAATNLALLMEQDACPELIEVAIKRLKEIRAKLEEIGQEG